MFKCSEMSAKTTNTMINDLKQIYKHMQHTETLYVEQKSIRLWHFSARGIFQPDAFFSLNQITSKGAHKDFKQNQANTSVFPTVQLKLSSVSSLIKLIRQAEGFLQSHCMFGPGTPNTLAWRWKKAMKRSVSLTE
jgi:hypothetical protein